MTVAEQDGIIVSSHVRRKVQALFEFEARGEVLLKGKSQPVPIFHLIGERDVPQPVRGVQDMRSPLVGREAEWTQLTQVIDRLVTGRGQIINLIGEAGLGKSRLTAELRRHASQAQLQWLEGRCLSYTETVSYWPFQDVLRQLSGLHPEHSVYEAWNTLRAIVQARLTPDEAENALPFLANFLNLPLDDALHDRLRYLDAEALQRRTFLAITSFVEASMRQPAPLALVLDDIHWIDQASAALLEYLMPLIDRGPLLLVLIHRPERAKRCWQIHERAAREYPHALTEIWLQPLKPQDSRQLLINLVQSQGWPLETQNALLNRTEGNPLYLEEVIRTLVDTGALARDEHGAWQLHGTPDTLQVPDTLEGVLLSRLDQLDEPCRHTAQVAAVVGRIFAFDVLAHLQANDRPRLNPNLVRLQQQEIVQEAQRTPDLLYTFNHILMQETCYRSLLINARRMYHRQIAAFLENRSVFLGEAVSNIPFIAYHAYAGQDWPRAWHYQRLAGQRAQQLFANHEAIDHYRKALDCAPHLPEVETAADRQAVHAALGQLLITSGQYDEANEQLNQAYDLAIQRGDRLGQANVIRWFARLYELRAEYAVALDWVQQGLALPIERDNADIVELLITASTPWILPGGSIS
jgi:predicted ATPase